MSQHRENLDPRVVAQLVRRAMRGKGGILYRVEHWSRPRDKSGTRELLVDQPWHNIWPDAFCLHVLDVSLRNQTQNATWYVLLKGAGTPAAADTLTSHASWSELAGSGTVYDGTRKSFAFNAAAVVGSVPGITGSTPAEFTISTSVSSQSVVGAALASVASGTSGVLGPVGDFASALSVNEGELVRVTPNVTLDDDGA